MLLTLVALALFVAIAIALATLFFILVAVANPTPSPPLPSSAARSHCSLSPAVVLMSTAHIFRSRRKLIVVFLPLSRSGGGSGGIICHS
jgi:hypothetical protein